MSSILLSKNFPTCVCGAKDYDLVLDFKKGEESYQILKCRQCDLFRTWPVPLKQEPDFYQKQDDYLKREDQLALRTSFARATLLRLKKHKQSGRLLDVGCNLGIFVKEAGRFGFDAHGIDPCHKAIERGKKIFHLNECLKTGDLTTINFPEVSFDVVTLIHCLEHISNLNSVLEKVYFILKKDGIILVELPNFNSFWRKLLGRNWYGFAFKQHYWQFDPTSLKKLLENHHFTTLLVDTRHNMYHRLSFSVAGLIKLIISFLSFIFQQGDNLVIIAKK
ncbi:MAG: class I SAM-dependent methyltransferase [Patescibacteria group bacterium]|nr:class I SAM-dependent methyltransferase [Patescibacteria group bacterium]